MEKVKKIALFCILTALLIVIVGCVEQPTKLASHRVAERSVPPTQNTKQVVEVNETEKEVVEVAVEANESAVQEKIYRYRPVEVVVEDTPDEVFNESKYLKINLSQISYDGSLYWEMFITDTKMRLNPLEKVMQIYGINRSLVNKTIAFDAAVLPRIPQTPDGEDCGLIFADGDIHLNLYQDKLVNNFSLCCNPSLTVS